jgi:hypothetical protein
MSTRGNTWPIDPTRPVVNVADARLQHLLLTDPQRCATLNEYASATGIDVDRLLDLFGPYLDDDTFRLETVGGEVFVLTAPLGRPQPLVQDQVPPNLWELFRRTGDEDHAYRLWRLTRELQSAGWTIEADTHRIPATSAGEVALVGLKMHRHVVPVLVFPNEGDVAHPAGVLTRFERRQVPFVAVMCDRGDLDPMVTAVRRWFLERPQLGNLRVLVLESPRFQPVLLGGNDASVAPRAITRDGLEALLDDLPDRHGGTTTGLESSEGDGVDPTLPPR